jgi:succinyl-CoA synthetase beta subunit
MRCFVRSDMAIAEIIALGELEDGSFTGLRAHVEMENEAHKHQMMQFSDSGGIDIEKVAEDARRPSQAGRRPRQ